MLLYKEFTFEAAHHLPHAFPEGHPNHNIHGHSFRVRVTIEGEPDPETGLIADLGEVKSKLQSIEARLDHKYLNRDVEGLSLPTLENITKWIWDALKPDMPLLKEVAVHRDTCREGCVYRG